MKYVHQIMQFHYMHLSVKSQTFDVYKCQHRQSQLGRLCLFVPMPSESFPVIFLWKSTDGAMDFLKSGLKTVLGAPEPGQQPTGAETVREFAQYSITSWTHSVPYNRKNSEFWGNCLSCRANSPVYLQPKIRLNPRVKVATAARLLLSSSIKNKPLRRASGDRIFSK